MWLQVSMYLCIYVYDTLTRVCMYVCVYVCVCIYLSIYVYIYLYTREYICHTYLFRP